MLPYLLDKSDLVTAGLFHPAGADQTLAQVCTCRLHCVGQFWGWGAGTALAALPAGEHCGCLCFLLLFFDAVSRQNDNGESDLGSDSSSFSC